MSHRPRASQDEDEPYLVDLTLYNSASPEKTFSFSIPRPAPGRYGLHVTFATHDYPFERHCCFARYTPAPQSQLKDLRRFVDMTFAAEPPGIRVGPWPGWRGIPPMPQVTLQQDGKTQSGEFNFWGDESEAKCVRVFFLIELPPHDEKFVLAWDERRWQPAELAIYPSARRKARLHPVKLREELQQRHPRLLFSPRELAQLRERRFHTHQDLWREIEQLLANWDLPFEITTESKALPGAERLHSQDKVILAAFHALITHHPASIQRALQSLAGFLAEAQQPDYEPMQIDTQAGECLYTLSLVYDWLRFAMTPEKEQEIREQMFAIAERVWQHLGYEREDYAQAHFLGCSHGLLAFALLFWEKHPQAKAWASYIRGAFESAMNMLPEDGFYPHGINLWIYEHAFLVRLLELFRHAAGDDLWQRSSYWRYASQFRMAALSPNGELGVTFGDPQFRVAGDAWIHYLIAARTGSKLAQWLGAQLAPQSTSNVDFRSATPRRRVWEYLYCDSELESERSDQQQSYFEDGGQLFCRSLVKNAEVLMTFRAGAPLGWQRYRSGEWSGYGHTDPCHGGFMLVWQDEFMLSGPGPVYRRDSALHNTITIDGRGQIGDSAPWAPAFIPLQRMPKTHTTFYQPSCVGVATDLTPAYLDFLGVQSLFRRWYFLRPSVIVINDKICLQKTREIQWNLHTFGSIAASPANARDQLMIRSGNRELELKVLLPSTFQWREGLSEFVPAYPNAGERDRFLQLYHNASAVEFLVLILLDPEETTCHFISPTEQSPHWRLVLRLSNAKFDLNSDGTLNVEN